MHIRSTCMSYKHTYMYIYKAFFFFFLEKDIYIKLYDTFRDSFFLDKYSDTHLKKN